MTYILVAMFFNTSGVPVVFKPREFETLEACENSEAPSFTKKYRDSAFEAAFMCIALEDFDQTAFDKHTGGITY